MTVPIATDPTASEAAFSLPMAQLANTVAPRISWRYVLEFLRDGETPLRTINDCAIRALMPYIEGPGAIIELGAGDDYYRQFAAAGQRYEITNLDSGDRHIDMTNMALADNSVDAFVSVFALEHIYDHHCVVQECLRCLKPKGRLLLAVPFMCYYHAAPDDYFRFTRSALDRMLSPFNVLKAFSLGNRELLVSMCYHEKAAMGSKKSALARAALRIACAPVLAAGLTGNQHDHVYAVGHVYLCEKPSS
jgi:SAM-dependent methyltransferase